MKKMICTLIAGCFLLMAATAMAIPYTNTVTFTSGNVLTGQGTFTWNHAVTPDFQIPFDTVNSANLTITSKRAVDGNDIVSVVAIKILGVLNANGNSPVDTSFDLAGLGVFSANWASGQPLEMSLAYIASDNKSLTMVSSKFELDYINVAAPVDPPTNAPVPEPGTMMLLGVGMLGLAIFGKRRMSKNS